jgi:ubiquinone/menaquinone biosynthesis C-methylase UbiE
MALSSASNRSDHNGLTPEQPKNVEASPEARVGDFYDELGTREWLRLQSEARARVIYHVHRSVLSRWVHSGHKVLDAGCGPGRFSIDLARWGADVTAGDISAVQISLAHQSFSSHLSAQLPLVRFSVTKLPFPDAAFDCAIAYGAVLSNSGRQAEVAAGELVRVTKPGGLIIVSVVPKGNLYLPYLLEQVRDYGIRAVDQAIARDESLPDGSYAGHSVPVPSIPWREFSQEELESLASSLGCSVLSISASNVLATVEQIPLLEEMETNVALWDAFLRWEEHLAAKRSYTEHGAHIIAVLRKDGTEAAN